MKELVEVIAKALVDDPESVVVNESEEKKTTGLDRPACGLSRLSYTAESYLQKKPLERRKRRK